MAKRLDIANNSRMDITDICVFTLPYLYLQIYLQESLIETGL